jgi:CheY-like chemotaxis protein
MNGHWKRVLVVDDSKVYRELMATLLRPHCRELVAVGGVAEALEQLSEPANFDLVICDVIMKGDDGFALLEALGERPGPRIPVVMVTGFRSEDGIARAQQLGAAGYLQKPTTVRQILGVLSEPGGQLGSHPPRLRCSGTASLVEPDTGRSGPLVWDLYNISRSGAFLETKGPIPVGSELDLAVEIGGGRVQVRARVVRVQQPSWMDIGGVGVEFVDPGADLDELVARITADTTTPRPTSSPRS